MCGGTHVAGLPGEPVYPRVCGGTVFVGSIPACAGEPCGPRVQPPAQVYGRRSIPACAGEPATRPFATWCGRSGSIPACAGEPPVTDPQQAGLRSIPACAGEPAPGEIYVPRVRGGSTLGLSPRVRGNRRHVGFTGDGRVRVEPIPGAGLSPRVRGNRVGRHCSAVCATAGSIPACAGEPGRITSRSIPACAGEPSRCMAHDRFQQRSIPACAGEPGGGVGFLDPRVCGGTSPSAARSIPACAGEPPECLDVPHGDGSIPACAGEPILSYSDIGTFSGLSPRVRGNRRRVAHVQRWEYPYPRVCGGTQSAVATAPGPHGVYPRVCGGTVTDSGVARVQLVCGVYPRVCGGTCRFPESPGNGACSTVYPRVCGGTVARGLAQCLSPATCGTRSIPACAGEPRRVSSANCRLISGLSPRVRGNPSWPGGWRGKAGSIPACAGEPRAIPAGASWPSWGSIPACAGEPIAGTGRVECRRGLSPRVRGNPGEHLRHTL